MNGNQANCLPQQQQIIEFRCFISRFDLEAKTWTVLKPMKTARGSASVAVFHGYIYVAGGRTSDTVRTNVVDLYDPANDDWMQVAPLNEVRSSFALFKSNMSLYAIGGAASVERYDAMMPRWTKVCNLLRESIPSHFQLLILN